MYDFIGGPLVWLAIAVFALGSAARILSMVAPARRDRAVIPTYDARFGLRSILHWMLPFGTRSMRLRPVHTAVSFAFHACLIATPLLAGGHAVLWERSWGVSWWSLPPLAADLMTLVVIGGGIFFFVRRLVAPEVRNVSTLGDHLLLLLAVSPFVTGLAAKQQWLDAELATALHIVCGAAWLVAIPYTRLAHMLWFAFTRSFMGSELGAVRNARDW